jgi:hypothetical protein
MYSPGQSSNNSVFIMSSTPSPIPMQSLPAPGAQTSGNATSNPTAANTSAQVPPVNTPSSLPTVPPLQAAPLQQPLVHPPASTAGRLGQRWKTLKRWLNYIVNTLLAIAGIIAAYIALSLAIWTSIKDYRDDCRSQNVSSGRAAFIFQ